ncbi:MAG: tryptophan 7-halogenase [Rhizobacter sp.]|nr:tryptophan 7-halogenase [Rhizobacter sp.]
MALPHPSTFDVAVVGAGPAGAATACRLARCGLRVLLLERSDMQSPRVGESLAPDVQPALRHLGVWDRFIALGPLPSWGTCSVWGGPEPQLHSHLQSPWASGWHVDRAAFDRLLAQAAGAAGAQLCERTVLRGLSFDGTAWVLHTNELFTAPRRARVVVDATGRRAQVARTLGARRLLFDSLVGIAVRWSGIDDGERGHLLVETAPQGWWYCAPLPGDGMVTMLMTDADLCAREHLNRAPVWHQALNAAPASLARVGRARCDAAPQVHVAHSQRVRRGVARDGARDGARDESRDGAHDASRQAGPWLAVGDAALAVDPISGSGVLRALNTAQAAAEAVQQVLAAGHDWRAPLAAYEAARDDECTRFLVERAQYYAAEARFDSPFWQRRQTAAAWPAAA